VKLNHFALWLSLLICSPILQAQTRPSVPADFTVGPMRQQQLVGFNFLYVTRRATIRTIAEIAGTEVPKLFDAIKAANIQERGPVIFIFHGMTGAPDQPFDVEMGMAVEENVVPPDGYETVELKPATCATVLYSGDMPNIGHAYEKVFPAMSAAGLTPSGETREYYLYFEDDKSPNNVVLVAIVSK